MTCIHIAKLGLVTCKTDIDTQKIHGLPLFTYQIVLAGFSV